MLCARIAIWNQAEFAGNTPEGRCSSPAPAVGRSALELVVIRNGQTVFVPVIEAYLPRIEYAGDEEWLDMAGTSGWVVFMKGARIRCNTAEREAVERFSVRCLCLSSRSLNGQAIAERLLAHIDAITEACVESGPFIYVVHQQRIERLL